MSLAARLTLDTGDYERGLDRAEKRSSIFGDVLKANLVTKGIEVAIDGFKRLASAASSAVQDIVASYADYEQLVGGVETLFKGAADKVKQYADDAYMTAGLSANEYMETVTSFSASLIQSLGGDTAKAADLANQAIIDMSDNSSKMGSSMESIQNAYAAFAKQNYTLLDNLMLGYGGTKSEMDRLIKDAAKLDKSFKYNTKTVKKNGKAVQELDYTYADIVKAIHIVQTNMGITGTTAKEASETISGSINMLKAAWRNLITGMGTGDQARISQLIQQVVQAAKTAFQNLQPVIIEGLNGIAQLITEMAPIISAELPRLVKGVLPSALKAAGSLMEAIFSAVPDMIGKGLPMVIRGLSDTVNGVIRALPNLMARLYRYILYDLGPDVAWAIADAMGGGYDMANDIYHKISGFTTGFKGIIDSIVGWIVSAWNGGLGDTLKEIAGFLLNELSPALKSFWDNVLNPIITKITPKIAEGIKKAWDESVHPVLTAIADWLKDEQIQQAINDFVDEILKLVDALGGFGEIFKWLIRLWAAKELALFFGAITTFVGGIVGSVTAFVAGLKSLVDIFTPAAAASAEAAAAATEAAAATATAAAETATVGAAAAAEAAAAAQASLAAAEAAMATATALLGGGAVVGGGLLGAGAGDALLGTGLGVGLGYGGKQLLLGAGKPPIETTFADGAASAGTTGGILSTIVAVTTKAIALLPGVAIGMQAVEEKANSAGVAADEAEYRVSQYTTLLQNAGKDAADDWAGFALGIDTSSDTIDGAIEKVRKGIADNKSEIVKDVGKTPKEAWDATSKEWDSYFGTNGQLGSNLRELKNEFDKLPNESETWGSHLIENFKRGIENAKNGLMNVVHGIAQRIRNFLGFSEPKEGPLSNFHTYAPDMMKLFAQGIQDNAGLVTGAIGNAFDFGTRLVPSVMNGTEYTETKHPAGSQKTMTVVLEIGGTEFARATVPYIDAEYQRIGAKVVKGVV